MCKELLYCGQSRPGRTVCFTEVLIIKSSSRGRARCFNLAAYWIYSHLEERERLFAPLGQKYSFKKGRTDKKRKTESFGIFSSVI